MVFTLKDLMYIALNAITVTGLFLRFQYQLKTLTRSNDTIKNVMFESKGGLNLVNNAKCKEHRRITDRRITQETAVAKDAIDQIQVLNLNIVKIMTHMDIEPVSKKPSSK